MAVLKTLSDDCIQVVCTSPPYWGLRDYGDEGQLGLEKTPEEYVKRLVRIFGEVRRVLKKDGILWLNLGDSYEGSGKGAKNYPGDYPKQNSNRGTVAGKTIQSYTTDLLKPKNLIGVPWRVAFALQEDGWYLRQDIVWAKPNPMPESVQDRCTRSHEYVFHFSKSPAYYYDADAIRERGTWSTLARQERAKPDHKRAPTARMAGMRPKPDKQRGHGRRHDGFNDRWDQMTKEEQCDLMRNKRDVWQIATKPFSEAHFATFPPELPRLCILAGSRPGDIVLDPFHGAGTTGMVAKNFGRKYIGIELNADYIKMSLKRFSQGILPCVY